MVSASDHIAAGLAPPPDPGYNVESLPLAIDHSHHLSVLSRSRPRSPLKKLIEFIKRPGMISLAGGLPHPSLFPFHSLTIDAYGTPFGPESITAPGSNESHHTFEISKNSASDPSLAVNLQYMAARTESYLLQWLHTLSQALYQPAYKDFEILLHIGNTDAWGKVVQLICNPGDYILIEEHTYPSSQAFWVPLGCKGAPIAVDKNGIIPSSLKEILDNWDKDHPSTRKPRLLYTVPIGQNPTGSIMFGARKKEIYDICVEHDVIICEDDPYYFLQMGPCNVDKESDINDPLPEFEPSFLKFDYQGRVIRLDSFSKISAPGHRLGWFVCNPVFSERLQRATEVTTQSPCGWSQSIMAELLKTWGPSGWAQWIDTMRRHYRMRRDWICISLADHFELVPASHAFPEGGVQGFTAFSKGATVKKPIFSFVPPEGGMFLWCDVHLGGSSLFNELSQKAQSNATTTEPLHQSDIELETIDTLFTLLADDGILISPGDYFVPYEGPDAIKRTHERPLGHIRLAFGTATREMMNEGIGRLEKVLSELWQ